MQFSKAAAEAVSDFERLHVCSFGCDCLHDFVKIRNRAGGREFVPHSSAAKRQRAAAVSHDTRLRAAYQKRVAINAFIFFRESNLPLTGDTNVDVTNAWMWMLEDRCMSDVCNIIYCWPIAVRCHM